LAGFTTLVSSTTNVRSRTIGIVGAVYAVSMVMKVIGRLLPKQRWHLLAYGSFFTPFEPQSLVSQNVPPWSMWTHAGGSLILGGLGYDSILIGLGLVFYIAAAVVFCRRDLPAPL
jgi:ABC-2 type transport system permease protein